MEIIVERHDTANAVSVKVVGELDLYSAPAFCKAAMDATMEGPSILVLDLSALEYLDSSGVGTIIQLLQQARKRGGELRVAGLAGSALKVLKMTNILQILKTYPDGKSALMQSREPGFFPIKANA